MTLKRLSNRAIQITFNDVKVYGLLRWGEVRLPTRGVLSPLQWNIVFYLYSLNGIDKNYTIAYADDLVTLPTGKSEKVLCEQNPSLYYQNIRKIPKATFNYKIFLIEQVDIWRDSHCVPNIFKSFSCFLVCTAEKTITVKDDSKNITNKTYFLNRLIHSPKWSDLEFSRLQFYIQKRYYKVYSTETETEIKKGTMIVLCKLALHYIIKYIIFPYLA